jgi:hypothetical protein
MKTSRCNISNVNTSRKLKHECQHRTKMQKHEVNPETKSIDIQLNRVVEAPKKTRTKAYIDQLRTQTTQRRTQIDKEA